MRVRFSGIRIDTILESHRECGRLLTLFFFSFIRAPIVCAACWDYWRSRCQMQRFGRPPSSNPSWYEAAGMESKVLAATYPAPPPFRTITHPGGCQGSR